VLRGPFRACIVEGLADKPHVRGCLDERRSNEVHLVLAAEVLHVVDVIEREDRKVHFHAWQVHVLALPKDFLVHRFALHLPIQDLVHTNRHKLVMSELAPRTNIQ
jgi:hypothetical protein